MKFLSLSIFICSFLLFSCDSNTVVDYNDTIIGPQLEVVEKLDSIYDGPEVSLEEIKKNRLELVSKVEKAMDEVRNLEDFKGNSSFKEAGIKYLGHLNLIYNKTQNIDSLIYNFNSEERVQAMTDEDYKFMENELKKYLELEKTLLDEQKKFAEKFNMRLEY